MSDNTRAITDKCEQYWNEPGPFTDAEVHSILEYIHNEANKAADEIERLRNPTPCTWKQDLSVEHEPFETSCGDAWCLDDGDPVLNRMNFCPSCGHPIKIGGEDG